MANYTGKQIRVFQDGIEVACCTNMGLSITNNTSNTATTCTDGFEKATPTTQANEITLEGLWVYDTSPKIDSDTMFDAANDQTVHDWKIGGLESGDVQYSFTGVITAFSFSADVTTDATQSATITGQEKFTKTVNP